MDDVIVFVGARGGQGTSTVAAVAAIHGARQAPTSLLCADPLATAALLGAPPALPGEYAQIAPGLTLSGLDGPRAALTIIDAGPVSTARVVPAGAHTIAVVRGPCYLALHTLVAQTDVQVHGVVVVAEAGRSLSELDVAEIIGVPVLGSVPVRPGIARMVDAGVLLSSAESRPELTPLRTLVDQLAPDLGHRSEADLCIPDPSPRAHLRVATAASSLDAGIGR